jgi:hypothetical protein
MIERLEMNPDPMRGVFQDSANNPFTGMDVGEWPGGDDGETDAELSERMCVMSERAKKLKGR